ncbi:MAG: hypothetical protein HY917_04030, partial [Candidatus Diapherotrites archaeon]|nr:hypothetical protein [Candidatus Diapherotrites archaeon]
YFVLNDTSSPAKNIRIFALQNGKKKSIQEIPLLKSGERVELNTSGLEGSATEISLEFPFHQSISRTIRPEEKQSGLEYSLIAPAQALQGIEYALTLKICNQNPSSARVGISEEHDAQILEGTHPQTSLEIPINGCREQSFTFTPRQSGSTAILFKMTFQQHTETIRKEIQVNENG